MLCTAGAIVGMACSLFAGRTVRSVFNGVMLAVVIGCLGTSVFSPPAVPDKFEAMEIPAELQNLPQPVQGLG